MPKVKKGEDKQKYISRCISHVMKKEGKPRKQAIAICYSYWRQHK